MRVSPITYQEALPFILYVHYARRVPCIQYAFGLFEDEALVGVVTYGKPASPFLCKGVAGYENRHRVIELNRLVVVTPTANAASFTVGRSLKQLPPGLFVVSYADTGKGHVGYVYQATNFLYTGLSVKYNDLFMEGKHSRHLDVCKDVCEKRPRSRKHRYVTFTGKDKTNMRKLLLYKVLPYPKGETHRYDVGNPDREEQE